jgi:hypothetical protein
LSLLPATATTTTTYTLNCHPLYTPLHPLLLCHRAVQKIKELKGNAQVEFLPLDLASFQ